MIIIIIILHLHIFKSVTNCFNLIFLNGAIALYFIFTKINSFAKNDFMIFNMVIGLKYVKIILQNKYCTCAYSGSKA